MAPGKSTPEVFFGKGRWCKLFTPSQYDKFSLEFYPDDDSLSRLLELKKRGIRNVISKTEDGYKVTLSRASQIKVEGKLRANTPPLVVDNEGKPWNPAVAIGNDSDLAVRVIVREYKLPMGQKGMGIALRLDGVKVLNLVEFDRNSFEAGHREAADHLEKAEEKTW